MQRALTLASQGKGKVSPNPCVGCVVVKGNKVIAQGYHPVYGGPHAEIVALRQAHGRTRGTTLYLTLEPCTHWGKTAPCAPEVAKAGFKQIFIAMRDPNPQVAGRGIRLLKKARIQVHVGLEEQAASQLNRAYVVWRQKKRPYVILKSALTLDGKTATEHGESKWITEPTTRRLVHQFRSEADAILVGATTANRDNPSLTSHGRGKNPVRLVMDPHLRTKPSLKIYNDQKADTWILTASSPPASKVRAFEKKGISVLPFPQNHSGLNLKSVLRYLSKNNISQLFVEGGSETTWPFVKNKMVEEVLYFIAPKLLGGRASKTPVGGKGFRSLTQALKIRTTSVARSGADLVVRGWV